MASCPKHTHKLSLLHHSLTLYMSLFHSNLYPHILFCSYTYTLTLSPTQLETNAKFLSLCLSSINPRTLSPVFEHPHPPTHTRLNVYTHTHTHKQTCNQHMCSLIKLYIYQLYFLYLTIKHFLLFSFHLSPHFALVHLYLA